MSRNELLTRADLDQFKSELIEEIKTLLSQSNQLISRPWLRSSEVRKMLGVSSGTLQNLRINGSLPFSKIGGIVYYRMNDIVKLLEDNSRPVSSNGKA
jgi:hypothetical protein